MTARNDSRWLSPSPVGEASEVGCTPDQGTAPADLTARTGWVRRRALEAQLARLERRTGGSEPGARDAVLRAERVAALLTLDDASLARIGTTAP
jgi:hypothetical protein